MALLSGFVFLKYVELFPPLIASIVLFSPSQQNSLFFLALYP
jgi:hypothetical protein